MEFHVAPHPTNDENVDSAPLVRCVTVTDVARCVKTRRQPPPRRRSPVDRTHQQLQVSTDVERADKAIHLWITKHKTPPRQDIIVWLLERLVLVPLAGSQYRVAFTHELVRSSTPNNRTNDVPTDEIAPRSDIGWDEDELPCFSAPSNDDSAYNDDEDEDLPAFSPVKRLQVQSQEFKDHHHDNPNHPHEDNADELVDRRHRKNHVTETQGFEPSPHVRASRVVEDGKSPPNAWANDSWRLVLELKKSKLDIARAREFQRKQDVIAAARKQRLLTAASKTRTHAKLDKQTKKLVHEATRDAIEYHKVLDTIERQTKTKNIQHMHEHELTTRFLRTGQRQKWHKGAWLGEGPFPSAAYVLPPPDTLPFVYDVHGRRHDAARAGDVTSQSLFDAVMTKIQREAAKAGKQLVAYFQRYDVDRSGTLTTGEFRRALVDMHVDASDEQMDVLFAWFDRNHTGGIDYGEFLWSFFNRRAFAKQWKATTTTTATSRPTSMTMARLEQMFYKHDSRHNRALTSRDFFVAMKELGFAFTAMDEALLVHQFDANGDGCIDLDEFVAAFSSAETDHNVQNERKDGHPPRSVDHSKPHQNVQQQPTVTPSRTKPRTQTTATRRTTSSTTPTTIQADMDELARIQRRLHSLLQQ
ncbi:hypothetical protein H257_10675 [Aphanomyces astaci]|uniref:EF-hand domain-containing protein n=1 Tax=Aphanomyces astaci TaxID=112090 RepID=W4G5V4_APHAT|nr:hypothetical protein H257_10675 [Aphanomyces astaci]ETV75082.1 hypothetical protein H257_10675 [Aphanomyces astaci]|eukprot:XP_009835586.1 hypothetical protein H257_10675 [Aphanomyces astaci]